MRNGGKGGQWSGIGESNKKLWKNAEYRKKMIISRREFWKNISKEEYDKICEMRSGENNGMFGKGELLKGEKNGKWVEKIVVQCKICGKDIITTKNGIENNKKYCSIKCKNKSMIGMHKGKKSARWVEKIIIQCKICNKDIITTQKGMENGKKYCCMKCKNVGHSIFMKKGGD